jgi:hypothetical protein
MDDSYLDLLFSQISPFDHVLFALRTLRELKLLKYFSEQQVSENVSLLIFLPLFILFLWST